MEAVLVSNGPGELYGWARPVLNELKRQAPELKTSLSLIPCQFASGNEAEIARQFGADTVSAPGAFLRYMATGQRPEGLGDSAGFVISLGGSADMALQLGKKLAYPTYRYSFVPSWHRRLRKLFVHDEQALKKARRKGAPEDRLELVGNLVADAVEGSAPLKDKGQPHILLLPGSRDGFAIHLVPLMIALADTLGERFPQAQFVWPVSRLLDAATVAAGIAGQEKATLHGVAGRREGDKVITPGGAVIRLIPEGERYAHMRAADLALTIPGTNTLELGIAGLPAIVMLPMNKPEVIPLEGVGHWLGLLPFIGTALKRQAVRLFVEGLDLPVSLPNRFSGEDLMLELKGKIHPAEVAERATELLNHPEDLARRRAGLETHMPRSGAAARLVRSVLKDVGV